MNTNRFVCTELKPIVPNPIQKAPLVETQAFSFAIICLLTAKVFNNNFMRSLILFVLFSAALHGLNGARGGPRKAKAKKVTVRILLSFAVSSLFH